MTFSNVIVASPHGKMKVLTAFLSKPENQISLSLDLVCQTEDRFIYANLLLSRLVLRSHLMNPKFSNDYLLVEAIHRN